MPLALHQDGRTQVIVIPGEEYIVNGERMIYMHDADCGARRFVRHNGEIVNFAPGEILTFKDGE